jgi:hypothetical protein
VAEQPQCRKAREIAAELALGVADPSERARALQHLEHCAACRQALEDLSLTADRLLLLAPEIDPPAGFEARVLASRAPSRFGPKRLLAAAAALVVAAALGAGSVWWATAGDRRTAAYYRDVLDTAHGRYFQASTLRTADGRVAGQVFGYQGNPSWLLLVAKRALPPAGYRIWLVTKSGRRISVGVMGVRPLGRGEAQGSWGGTIPVDLSSVASVELEGPRPAEAYFRRD